MNTTHSAEKKSTLQKAPSSAHTETS